MRLRTSPLFISLVSIFPGLGLWLLGKRRHAVVAASLVFGSLFVFLAAPWAWVMNVSCDVAVFLWAIQIFYAGYEANLKRKIAIGAAQEARQDAFLPSSPPPSVKGIEKLAFKAKEIVRHQLGIGEPLLDAVPATQMSILKGAHSYRLYYIGLLRDGIVVVDTDFFGKPAALQRIKFSSISSIEIKQGLLNDKLVISFGNSEKPLELKINRRLRGHTIRFKETFLSYKAEEE